MYICMASAHGEKVRKMEKPIPSTLSPKSSPQVGNVVVREGQLITIDGVTGEVMLGEVPTVPPQLSGAFGTRSKDLESFPNIA